MYILKTNTAIRIPVGPLVDPTDGKTAETGLTVTALSVQLYQMATNGGAVVRTQFAPTASGGSNDMILVPSSTDGMYDLELTAAQLNWLGNGQLNIYDVDGCLVCPIKINVVSEQYFNFIYGDTNISANLTSTALAAVADKYLGRNIEGGSDTAPTVSEAFQGIRNRHGIDAEDGLYKVYENDGTTLSWSATVTALPDAAPVVGLNPT